MAKKKKATRTTRSSNGSSDKRKPAAKPKTQEEVVAIPLEREFPPEHQLATFANHFVIQHHEDEFYLMFFQTRKPVFLAGTEEEQRKKLREIKSVKAQCVAHVTMSPAKTAAVVQAMQENLARYRESQEAVDGTET